MLIGYVGADSEMKFTAAGIPVANFSLAVKEVYKNGDGEKKTNTLWIHCVAWRRWAEIVGEHVSKGKFLYVEGRLQLRAYEDREGQKRNVSGSCCHHATFPRFSPQERERREAR